MKAKNPNQEQQFLAFDFGTKHIGVAVGQTLNQNAHGLAQLKARDGIPDWKEIDALVNTWKPHGLIIGLPLNMDGSNSTMGERAKKFSNRLADRYNLPCHLVDERLSSFEVKQELALENNKKKVTEIDSLAAAVILRSWLNQQANTKNSQ